MQMQMQTSTTRLSESFGMAGEAPERGEGERIGKAASHETPVGVKIQTGLTLNTLTFCEGCIVCIPNQYFLSTGGGSASHVTPVGVKLQAGGPKVFQ